MDNDRTMFGVVCANVLEVETLGHHVVYLYRSELPFATYRIAHDEVDLRTVECSLTFADEIFEIHFISNGLDLCLCAFPIFEIAAIFGFVIITE